MVECRGGCHCTCWATTTRRRRRHVTRPHQRIFHPNHHHRPTTNSSRQPFEVVSNDLVNQESLFEVQLGQFGFQTRPTWLIRGRRGFEVVELVEVHPFRIFAVTTTPIDARWEPFSPWIHLERRTISLSKPKCWKSCARLKEQRGGGSELIQNSSSRWKIWLLGRTGEQTSS